MSQAEKAAYWRELKDAGVEMPLHYREYTTEQLARAVKKLREGAATTAPEAALETTPIAGAPVPRVTPADEVAGLRQNTYDPETPIRTDENGLVWYQDEVRKAAFPKPRGRRLQQYNDTGVQKQTIKNGDYLESFEMPGDGPGRLLEARITLPSYQVGTYLDPRFPFKIHTYNGNKGFDLFEVEKFYGGAEFIPSTVKRIYVDSVLAYDIPSTVRAITAEARDLQLKKGI